MPYSRCQSPFSGPDRRLLDEKLYWGSSQFPIIMRVAVVLSPEAWYEHFESFDSALGGIRIVPRAFQMDAIQLLVVAQGAAIGLGSSLATGTTLGSDVVLNGLLDSLAINLALDVLGSLPASLLGHGNIVAQTASSWDLLGALLIGGVATAEVAVDKEAHEKVGQGSKVEYVEPDGEGLSVGSDARDSLESVGSLGLVDGRNDLGGLTVGASKVGGGAEEVGTGSSKRGGRHRRAIDGSINSGLGDILGNLNNGGDVV